MKLERKHISLFVGVAALIWFIVLVAQGTPITLDHARPFGIVITLLVGLGTLFELVIWRSPLLFGWLVARPDLRGTWLVELQSNYVDPNTKQRIRPIICYMGVNQTLSTLKMHLMTPESESWLIASHVRKSPNDNGFQVIGVYTNEPNVHLRHERISEMHTGAFLLETHGPSRKPSSINGKYWTDRSTTGSLDFIMNRPKIYTRFDEAHKDFQRSDAEN